MPAAEGLEFRETARSRNGPHKAQGAAATRASWVKLGDVAGRQHGCCCAHHRELSSDVSAEAY